MPKPPIKAPPPHLTGYSGPSPPLKGAPPYPPAPSKASGSQQDAQGVAPMNVDEGESPQSPHQSDEGNSPKLEDCMAFTAEYLATVKAPPTEEAVVGPPVKPPPLMLSGTGAQRVVPNLEPISKYGVVPVAPVGPVVRSRISRGHSSMQPVPCYSSSQVRWYPPPQV